MSDEETDLDRRLRDHLLRTLKPHVGRSAAVFEDSIRNVPRPPAHRVIAPWLAFLGSGGAIAAALLLAFMLWKPGVSQRTAETFNTPRPPVRTPGTRDAGPRDVEQVIAWQNSDEGVDVIGQKVPVQVVRQDALEEIKWFDPKSQSSMRLTVPRQQVILIEQETH